jgi:intracellular sulfur oxidation DsrE/DsrF family protein
LVQRVNARAQGNFAQENMTMLDPKASKPDSFKPRRWFLSGAAATAAAFGFGKVASSADAVPPTATGGGTDFQKWLDRIKGQYRQVYDMPEPNNGFGLIWSHVYLLTGAQGYGVSESELGVVVVLRHNAIPIALNDSMWAKYTLGEFFKINDPATKAPATRNPFAHIKPGDLPIPDAALDKLVARGVMFGACNMAITFRSAAVAKQMGLRPEDVKKDWIDNLLPGVQVVPSGVVAVNGAQARGCSYCFAG